MLSDCDDFWLHERADSTIGAIGAASRGERARHGRDIRADRRVLLVRTRSAVGPRRRSLRRNMALPRHVQRVIVRLWW